MEQPALWQLLSQWGMLQDQRAAIVASTIEAGQTAQPVQLPRSGSSSGKDTVGSNPAHWQHPCKYKSQKQPYYRDCRSDRRFSQSFRGCRYYVVPRARRHHTPVNPRNNGYSSRCQGDRPDTRKEWIDERLVPSFSDSSSCPESPQPKSHSIGPNLNQWIGIPPSVRETSKFLAAHCLSWVGFQKNSYVRISKSLEPFKPALLISSSVMLSQDG